MQAPSTETTRVAIVGGGPAGLMLSHLLGQAGIDNIVIEARDHDTIYNTHRAGILEAGVVKMLAESGVDGRVQTLGDEHAGIDLRFNGQSHPLDFRELVDATVTLYSQTEVFLDLAAARRRDGGDMRFECKVTAVDDVLTDKPKLHYVDAEGSEHEIVADMIVGADGSHSLCRKAMPGQSYFNEYPFAWFGILTEAPKSAPELVYANSEYGFALISQRSETVQRMYFQCDPGENADAWSDDRIWSELQKRVAGADGFELKTGPIFDKTVLPFRSYVHEPLSHGRLYLAGDAGHTVPPTGAKGLNLAFADVRLLFEAVDSFYATNNSALLDSYSERALLRVWKAQNFSYWMTTMLHKPANADLFAHKRAIGELATVAGSRYGQQYLAESYTGWPHA